MNIKIVSIADNALQIQIEKEDYSLADIVHRELLNVKHVKFAGVPPPHPLLKTLAVQVHTDGTAPMKLVNEALDLAMDRVTELLKEANEIFPREPKLSRASPEAAIPAASGDRMQYASENMTSSESSELRDVTPDSSV